MQQPFKHWLFYTMSFKADVTGKPTKVPSAAAADDIPILVCTNEVIF